MYIFVDDIKISLHTYFNKLYSLSTFSICCCNQIRMILDKVGQEQSVIMTQGQSEARAAGRGEGTVSLDDPLVALYLHYTS